MEELVKTQALNYLKQELHSLQGRGDEEKLKKYKELEEILEHINLSMLETNDNVASPGNPKRRKISRTGSESNDGQLFENEHVLEETNKQIDVIKKALNIIYDMERKSFKKYISKNGKKRRNISRVHLLNRIMENGRAIPLWVGKNEEKPPVLCGAIEADENYAADVGDMVAAFIKQDKGSSWILAEVIAYDPSKKEYIVDDIYEEQKMEQVLSLNKIIPLPTMRADPETNPEALFQKNCLVLALYPGTTCFYRAIVDILPVKAEDPYVLLFEDDTYETGYSSPISVHQRYVIHFRKTEDEIKEESDR